MAKIESVNPDARIKVASVLPNGLLTIWNPARNGVRRAISQTKYPNYGRALLAAKEFEDLQRKNARLVSEG